MTGKILFPVLCIYKTGEGFLSTVALYVLATDTCIVKTYLSVE
ncbi:hypothetical protein [Cytophaga hutchinsonii]|nr:hypothetical protein [Cytophaga hutchinsonii]